MLKIKFTFLNFQVVVEEFIYSGTIGILTPYNPDYISIKSDADGKRPENTTRRWGEYHCTAGLQFDWIGFQQKIKYVVLCW